MNLSQSSVFQIADAVRQKKIKTTEVVSHFLSECQTKNATINAFVSFNERAIEHAEAIDKVVSQGKDPGPLAGVPIGVKDLFCVEGLESAACSKILQGFKPTYTATVVKQLVAAGAVVLGKTNQDEFAMGSSNENSPHGPCKNPWDLERVPGGSSGGSAAAVAANLVPASVGTDTGGSIRQPASFCNLVGVKPTYGRLSRYGMIAFASSLDQAGPMTKTVAESAKLLSIMSGGDTRDSTCAQLESPDFHSNLRAEVKEKKIGIIKNFSNAKIDNNVKSEFEKTIKMLEGAGAEIIEVELPHIEYSVEAYYLIATSEASSNLARYDGVRYGYRAEFSEKPPGSLLEFYSKTRGEGFGKEVKRRIVLGTFALSSGYYDQYYQKAGQVRRKIYDDFISAFKTCDLLVSPVTTGPAFKLDDLCHDVIAMYYNDVFTTGASLAGLPSMSVPMGFSKDNLPIGLQIIAPHFGEQRMLNLAQFVESETRHYLRSPGDD